MFEKRLFDNFLDTYSEIEKNKIWENNKKLVNDFWINTVGKTNEEISDFEIDEIVKILDRNGKGNTKGAESVGKVMIPQGAWRRLFNQFVKDKKLYELITNIANSSDKDRAINIDKLYKYNIKNKNHLTGKSGNAINCLLAALSPFTNLSIVSLKDRVKLLEYIYGDKINEEFNRKSIGEQIVITQNKILDYFSENNLTTNARTISCFTYSKEFKQRWKSNQEIEADLSEEEDLIDDKEELKYQFYMENN